MYSDEGSLEAERAAQSHPNRAAEFAVGFAYWLGFLLLLQPGNLVEMAWAGVHVAWEAEALRIVGAAMLGGAVSPFLFTLGRRFPIEGAHWRWHAAVHAVALPFIAFGLIGLAQVLAGVLLSGRDPRLRAPLHVELASNGAILVIAMLAFVTTVHAVRFLRRFEAERAVATAARSGARATDHVAIRSKGGVFLAPFDGIDWIESQDNYIALHCGPKVHLVRDTLAKFQRRLDPAEFVRIHRGTIVRANRVSSLRHLSNGDALVILKDGTALRLSRSYREAAYALFARQSDCRMTVAGQSEHVSGICRHDPAPEDA